MSRYDWMADALCAQTDPDLFHQDTGADYRTAKRICNNCPVQQQCEAHTDRLDADDAGYGKHGLWASRTRRQRKTSSGRHPLYSRDNIIRLVERGGMNAYEIADHIGCDVRTVWRVTKAHREQMGEAA